MFIYMNRWSDSRSSCVYSLGEVAPPGDKNGRAPEPFWAWYRDRCMVNFMAIKDIDSKNNEGGRWWFVVPEAVSF